MKKFAKLSLIAKIWRVTWLSVVLFFGITLFWVTSLKWINPPTTFLHLTTDCPEGVAFHKQWVDGDKISNYMKLAVVASEDNNFMKHGGIDWGAVEKARKYNETEGKKKGKYRGASTITQQTAKNVFLWPGSSKFSKWIRKAFEVYFTYLIEWIWGKDRIMEVYLNVIEFGPKIFGIHEAAVHYFGKRPDKLTLAEVAWLVSIIPGPKRYHTYWERGAITPQYFIRMKRYIQAMYNRERITQEELDEALLVIPEFYKPGPDDPVLRPQEAVVPLFDDDLTPPPMLLAPVDP
jgi:monofunctional biosynthetic peptidoglycan transglycosylase